MHDINHVTFVSPPGDTLAAQLLAPDILPHVIADCEVLAIAEVERLGVALRAALGMAERLRPNVIERSVRELLPEFVHEIEPFYRDYRVAGAPDFGTYVMARRFRVAQAMLMVGDRRVRRSHSRVIRSAYDRVRGRAQREITAAMPGISTILGRYAK